MPPTRRRKGRSRKVIELEVWAKDRHWKVVQGELCPGPGRPAKTEPLFDVVAEKIPADALTDVERDFDKLGIKTNGVYIAHDSMGTPRYIGRGAVFTRLRAHLKTHQRELLYFSFFIVRDVGHEREIETLLIRSAGANLFFNERKKRVDIQPGNVRDYEPGTLFYERQNKRGRKVRRPPTR
jgi:hypothetical protein